MSAVWDIDATWANDTGTWIATQFVPAGSTDEQIEVALLDLLASEADECPDDRLVEWERAYTEDDQ